MEAFDQGDYRDKFSDFYSFIRIIGRGAFGTVVHALNKNSGEEVAVKVIRKKSLNDTHVKLLRREAHLMSSLSHPNVVQFKSLKETHLRIFLEMEIIFGANLQELINSKGHFAEEEAKRIMRAVMEGICYIHSQRITHRDIKPENILVTPSGDVKITDFGLSTDARHKNENCGTLLYMAPEQSLSPFYSQSVDIWSCGIILYMLLCRGQHPLVSD